MTYESGSQYLVYTDLGVLGVSFSRDYGCVTFPNGRKICRRMNQMLGQGWEVVVAIVGIVSACVGTAGTVYSIVQNERAERLAREAEAEVARIQAATEAVRAETLALATEAEEEQTEQTSMLTKAGIGVGIAALIGLGLALT